MKVTPMKQMRRKCLDCCLNSKQEVRECTAYHCALYPYRMGRRPTEKEIETHVNALKQAKRF